MKKNKAKGYLPLSKKVSRFRRMCEEQEKQTGTIDGKGECPVNRGRERKMKNARHPNEKQQEIRWLRVVWSQRAAGRLPTRLTRKGGAQKSNHRVREKSNGKSRRGQVLKQSETFKKKKKRDKSGGGN